MDRAKSDEVPWSIVPSLEKLGKNIMADRELLITTTPEMNYMVGWSPTKSHPYVTVYLPSLHRANAYLHVLVGHELFHPIVEDFVRTEKSKVDSQLRDECKDLLSGNKGSLPLFDQSRLDRVVLHTMRLWEKGLTELMCDMGAAAIFGPAALFSFSSFACTRDMDQEPKASTQYYPPWRLRLQTVIEYLSLIHI